MSISLAYHHQLNACGLVCPMPLLKTKLKLRELNPSEVLFVRASDQGSWRDIPRFIEQSPYKLLLAQEVSNEYHFFIQKND
ncbi:MAG: sulfurtransferase TusA family protein [Venatoribacter sp.]